MSESIITTRLVLVDDHPLVRDGLRARLDNRSQIRIVGEADDAAGALKVIAEQNPHIALVDVGLTDISGIELARQLRQLHPDVAVLILSMHDNPDYVAQAVKAGARGYVLKNSSTQQIIAAIDAVAAGGTYFSSDVISAVGASAQISLSNREQDVLNHIVEGRSSKEIARLLKLSARTVETHRQTIKRKLGIDSSAGLVKWAIKNGLTKL